MPRALLSVSDKTGLVEFAQGLHALGWSLLASGSTAQTLRTARLPVTEVGDYTGTPEMLGGRVKTLHPAIHAGLLARATPQDQAELTQVGWDYIDLVAVNLYPFQKVITEAETSLETAIENIDIGGVALIRAAAKNFARVLLACAPADYQTILQALRTEKNSLALRRQLAIKGFAATCDYDRAISDYLAETKSEALILHPIQALRYGENPHQAATLYAFAPDSGPLGGRLIQGKPLSYNNLLDMDAAWRAASSFTKPTVCIAKHLSPCGIASSDNLVTAFQAALACDPISAFGGIIASNHLIDEKMVSAFGDLFIEAIVAPQFSPAALALLAQRSNCRLLEINTHVSNPATEWRSIRGGLLKQDLDNGDPQNAQWQAVTQRQPTAAEWESLHFAWRACQHVKSNAIILAQGEAAIGIGSGQPNRIDCVNIAAQRAGVKTAGAVLASDAFFPFSDVIEAAAKLGIAAIIQPGGARRDAEVIAAADKAQLAMIFTGVRHFRH
jgi:phosphoribosylaminoimidazolecarboxamide formyltransferase/IMP cyclohydrolase